MAMPGLKPRASAVDNAHTHVPLKADQSRLPTCCTSSAGGDYMASSMCTCLVYLSWVGGMPEVHANAGRVVHAWPTWQCPTATPAYRTVDCNTIGILCDLFCMHRS